MSGEIDPIVQGGGIAGGIAVLVGIIYKFYQTFKNDSTSAAKGDNVDARISAFTTTLQAQLDKAIARADTLQASLVTLQIENGKLAAQVATAQARAELLAQENIQLRADLASLRGRITSEGLK